MNLKKITSLTMLWSIIVMTYTGIMLFIAPPGRIANWANWKLLGLEKEDYAQIHSTFMVLFIVMTFLHVFYNWKPITSYMKNKAKEMVFLTKDMLVALFLTIIFIFGTLIAIPPFTTFLDFGDDVKQSWEKEYGTAPYSHAELSSIKMFSKKMGYDLEKSKEILNLNNIKFEQTQSLVQIAEKNRVSPQFIYNLLKKNFEKDGQKSLALTGMGKKTVSEIAQTLNLSNEEFILKLKAIGIEANADDKFRKTLEKYDMSPMDVIEKLGYKKSAK